MFQKIEETENQENWTVVVFNCPSDDWSNILVRLFKYVAQIKEADIPHFTLRFARLKPSRLLTISFRVLRDKKHAELVERQLGKFMKKEHLDYRINPEGEDHFARCHKWRDLARWPRKRCEALNRLSRFVVFLAEESLFDPDNRFEWGHLAINMLGLQESVVVGRMSAYTDLVTGRWKGPYATNIIGVRK